MRKAVGVAACAAVVAVFGVLAPAARADLKMEQIVMTSGETDSDGNVLKDSTKPRTRYYAVGKYRQDFDGTVMILDYAADKRIVLNTKNKTYYETSFEEWLPSYPTSADLAIRGDVVVKDTKEEKLIAGKTARHYRYSMTMVTKNATESEIAQLAPEIVFSGDLWTIRYKGDDNVAHTKSAKLSVSPELSVSLRKIGELMKPVAEKFAAIKGVPIEGTTQLKITVNPSAPADLKADIPPARTETTKTTTWSEEALAASTFEVPLGYTKIAVPKKTDDEDK